MRASKPRKMRFWGRRELPPLRILSGSSMAVVLLQSLPDQGLAPEKFGGPKAFVPGQLQGLNRDAALTAGDFQPWRDQAQDRARRAQAPLDFFLPGPRIT